MSSNLVLLGKFFADCYIFHYTWDKVFSDLLCFVIKHSDLIILSVPWSLLTENNRFPAMQKTCLTLKRYPSIHFILLIPL